MEQKIGAITGTDAKKTGDAISELDIEKVYPNPRQPRKVFDKAALGELSASIEKHGMIQPIVVVRTGAKYMIIAGERRYRASKIAGRKTIPAVIREYSEEDVKEVALIENIQREDLNPIETANAMKLLMEERSLTQEELAERLGKSRSAIANTLRLLSLTESVREMVSRGELSAGHARALVPLPKREQEKYAVKTVKSGFSVRQIEKAVRERLRPSEKAKSPKREISVELKDLVERLQRGLGTKVCAVGNDEKGRIYIDYYTRDDLDRISDIADDIVRKKD